MNKERIAELKAQFPELWQAKRLAGLPEETVAIVIQSQLDHDAAHPPHLEIIRDSKRTIEMAAAAVALALTRLSQAKASRDATLALYPDAELPALPSLGDASAGLDEIRSMLAKREQDVIDLGAEITLKKERIEQLEAELGELQSDAEKDGQKIVDLETELAEINPRLSGLQLDHQALLKQRDEATAHAAQLQEQLDTALSAPPEPAPKPKAKK